MARHNRESGRMTDPAASAVLAAFDAAQDAGLPSVDCYRAGVEAWHRSHPNQTAAYAGSQAVAIILAARVTLRVRRCVKHRGFHTERPTVANDGGPSRGVRSNTLCLRALTTRS
jgi:hypothetical protein